MRPSHVALLLFMGAFAVIYAYAPAREDREAKLAEVTRILAVTRRDVASDSAQSNYAFRSFAPAAGAMASDAAASPPATDASGKRQPKLVAGPARVSRATVPAAATGSWTAVVTAEPTTGTRKSPLSGLKAVKPSSDAARYELVRDLQAELKRIGCFGGEISGAWGAGTKHAMTEFTERVNARLPIDEPDYVLLALLKSHSAKACGDACPSGQAPSESGRCVPRAVLAQAEKKRAAQEKRLAAAATKTGASSWTTITQAEPAAAPAVADRRVPAPAAVAAAPTIAPLPGRMTIGGPRTPVAPVAEARPAPVAPPAVSPVAAPIRVAAVDPAEVQPAVEPPAATGSVTPPPPRAISSERAPKRTVRVSGPGRPYRVGRYVPPPPDMLGSFYHDKPAYTAARSRW